jgi:hypothetical protein
MPIAVFFIAAKIAARLDAGKQRFGAKWFGTNRAI